MIRARLSMAALACASLFAASSASADTDTSAAAHKAASDRYHHGIELYKKASQTHDPADFERAYLEFAQAYSIYPDDKVLWNLGASELETKRFVSALHHFRTYDAHLHVSDDPKHPDHAKLATYLDRSYAATGHLDIKAPAGAKITVDGTAAGVAPLADIVDVESGTHQVASDAESRSVDAADGQVVKVVFAAGTTGGGAAVVVVAPVATTTTAPTSSTAAVVHDAPPAVSSAGGSIPTGAWILGGVGLVAVGVGIVFAIDASAKNDSVAAANASGACVDPTSASCTNAQSDKSSRDRDRAIEGVGFGVGGAALVGGVLWAVLGRRHSADTAFLLPDIGVGRAGVRAVASF